MNTGPHILLTGATGFIGSHLAETLVEKGFRVTALTRKSAGTSVLKDKGIHILEADITDKGAIQHAFDQLATDNKQVDYVIHAAALTKAKTADELILANCKGTGIILQALERSGLSPGKFIFISSLAASGPQKLGGLIKKEQAQPITAYGKSKLQAEAIVKASPVPYIILRPTAVYGPREKDLFTVFKLVNRKLNPVIGSGRQELTFVHVKDLVNLIISAMQSEKKNKTYFVTDGLLYSKTALAEAISSSFNKRSHTIRLPLFLVRSLAFLSQHLSALAGSQSAFNLEKYKELTAQSWNCDVHTTFSELHYQPIYDLNKGVEETTRWYKENKWIK